MVSDGRVAVAVVYSPGPRDVQETVVHLPPGSTVLQALRASGLLERFPEIDGDELPVGIWGRKVTRDQALVHGDRVEIYRPLRVDPKVARRERFARQGARAAGLFTTKRPGSKAGY